MAKKKDNAWLLDSFNSVKKTFRKRNINIKFSIPDFIMKEDFVFDKPFLKDDFTLRVPITKKKLFTIKKQGRIKKHYHIDRVKVFKKTLYLDNKLVGIVQEVFDNKGFQTREDKKKPIIISKSKKDYGWHIQFELPPGISYKQVKEIQNYFADAIKGYVDIQWNEGYCHFDLMTEKLPDKIPFIWDPTPYMDKMALPWPIGYTHGNQLVVMDLAKFPHALAGGATNFGKSSFIYVLIMSMLFLQKHVPDRVRVVIGDLKGLDFYLLNNHALVLEDLPSIQKFMLWLHKEYERRKKVIRKYRCKKIQQFHEKCPDNDLPYIVFVIDEFAEIQDKNISAMVNRAVRLYRAVGIHLVCATQRPSIVGGVMDGDTRGQLPARICFKVACEADSRMILGDQYSEAAWLPSDVPGRAFFNFGIETKMIQSMFIDEKLEEQLLYQLDNWGCNNGQQATGNLQIKG